MIEDRGLDLQFTVNIIAHYFTYSIFSTFSRVKCKQIAIVASQVGTVALSVV